MSVFNVRITTLVRSSYSLTSLSSMRNLHIPCKSTGNKTVTWSSLNVRTTQKQITENIKLIKIDSKDDEKEIQRPLVLMLEWLMAKPKHVGKFMDIYLKHGFDVLAVKLKPWQLIWPMKGSQLVAGDILNVLMENHLNQLIMIHGFSVGAYLWGEVQLKMVTDLEKHQPLINNISGAIWDSAVDIDETAIGVPAAVFPNNPFLQKACNKYILYHMKTFEKEATQFWRKSREMFYRPIVKCPALLLYSMTDPIGNPKSYKNVRISYESLGIQIYEKCWDRSPHVAHYAFHREEYVNQVEMFLEKIGVLDSLSHKTAAVM